MPARREKASVEGGRQSAYIARNRAALLSAGREILAIYGPGATIEEIVAHAEVSPTTIYKYFESRDGLLGAAQLSLWQEWEMWALDCAKEIKDPLSRFITPLRLLIRVKSTHPQFAEALVHSTSNPDFLIAHLSANSEREVRALAKMGVLSHDNLDGRYLLFCHSIVAIIKKSLAHSSPKPLEGEKMLTIALGLLGVTEAKAMKALSVMLKLPANQ